MKREYMDGLLQTVFTSLERDGIEYALLRGDGEPQGVKHSVEVDLLVSSRQLARLESALHAAGFVSIPSWGYSPHHFFVVYDEIRDRWLKLDVVTDLCFGSPIRSLRVNGAALLLGRRVRRGNVYVLSPEDELLALLLHCLLDKGEFEGPYRRRLVSLLEQVRSDPSSARNAAALAQRVVSPALSWVFLVRAIEAEDWELLLSHRRDLAWRFFRRRFLSTIWRELVGRCGRRLRPLLFAMFRPGLAVVLLAPDGGGKTTLAQRLAKEDFIRARVVYMGMNADSSTVGLPITPWLQRRLKLARGKPQGLSGLILKGLSFLNRLAEQWYRVGVALYHKSRGRFVIFDRFVYDSWLAGRPLKGWKRLRRSLLEVGWPKADLVLVLDAPAEQLYKRKQDHPPDWLESQRHGYLALRQRVPQLVVVDATQEPDQVRRTVISLIWDRYGSRNGVRSLDERSC
jgi:thymidylate kinase